jgi:type I restriction enzyme S subunit
MSNKERDIYNISTTFRDIKLKYGVERKTEKISEIGEDTTRLSLSMVESKTGKVNLDSDVDLSTGLVRFGQEDVLFSKLRPYLAKAVNPDFSGAASPEFLVLEPNKFEPRYLLYVLLSAPFIQRVDSSTYGAKMPRASWEFIGNIRVPCPDISVQRQLSNWIKGEVQKIDETLEILNELSVKAEEYSTTIVTNSIHGKSSTPNSGNMSIHEWLNNVPSSWNVTKLKYISDIQTGVTKGGFSNQEEKVSVPYLRVANVQDGYLDLSDIKEIEIPPSDVDKYQLRPGDILMNEGGDFDKLGRGAVWNGEIEPCVHQNHVFAVRPHNEDQSEWISKLTESPIYKHYFSMKSKQSTNLASLSVSSLKETPIVLPPRKKRQKLLKKINNEESNTAQIKESADLMMKVLMEKRQALITAAVTGQIDMSEEKGVIQADD